MENYEKLIFSILKGLISILTTRERIGERECIYRNEGRMGFFQNGASSFCLFVFVFVFCLFLFFLNYGSKLSKYCFDQLKDHSMETVFSPELGNSPLLMSKSEKFTLSQSENNFTLFDWNCFHSNFHSFTLREAIGCRYYSKRLCW